MKKKVTVPLLSTLSLLAMPTVMAAEPESAINAGDTAWVLISAALVFVMTPALALFYGGMVRSKNVLATIMQSMFILAMISVEFVLIGYTMAFGPDVQGLIGDFSKIGLAGVGMLAQRQVEPRHALEDSLRVGELAEAPLAVVGTHA